MSRRRSPAPQGQLILMLAAMMLVFAVLLLGVGQGLAGVLHGQGWLWPSRPVPGLVRLLAGHPGVGLAPGLSAPPTALVYTVAVFLELLLLTTAAGLGWLVRNAGQTGGPSGGASSRDGMATRQEVRAVVGRQRLYRNRALTRPDLYRTSNPDATVFGLPRRKHR
ncbi:MAG: uncharacterized protein JWN95_1350 [Frankiales bacterium]|nr:uncharacterized protein [Frankiales bacterium]